MATLAEVSDGMTQVNGEPMPDICYVVARGGQQIDSGDQRLRDVAVAWADEDKDKFFLLQLVMDGGAWLVGNGKLLIPGGEAVLARLQEWAVPPSVLHLFACWRAAPTAENMLDLLDLVISIIVDTRAIDLGRAAPLRPLVQSLAQPGATAKDTARLVEAVTRLAGGPHCFDVPASSSAFASILRLRLRDCVASHERQHQAAALPTPPAAVGGSGGAARADPCILITPTKLLPPLAAGSDDGVRLGQAMRGDDRLALHALGDGLTNWSAQAVFLTGFVIEQQAAGTTRGLSSLMAETAARIRPGVAPDKLVKLFFYAGCFSLGEAERLIRQAFAMDAHTPITLQEIDDIGTILAASKVTGPVVSAWAG